MSSSILFLRSYCFSAHAAASKVGADRRFHAWPLPMNANGTRLAALTKELWGQWQQTKQYWKDSKSEAFEQKYLDELVASIDKTVMVIEQLDKLIGRVRRDCE